MSNRHVVFGAGPVGRAVITELLARSERVVLASRGARPAWLDARVEHVRADATDPATTRLACTGATHVFNCTNAAQYHRWPEQFPPLQRGVLEGARASGAVLVAVENLYVYGPHGGVPMTEDLPLHGRGLRSTTRVDMTKALEAVSDVRVVRVRASDLIGPGVTESMAGARMFEPILSGAKTLKLMADPTLAHAVTSVTDFAKTLVAAGLDERTFGQVLHAPSLAPTPAELVQLIAEEAGVQAPRLSAPSRTMASWMIPVLGVFVPELRGLTENTSMFYEPFIVDSTRARTLLGLEATPLRQTIGDAIAWYRSNGVGAQNARERSNTATRPA
jgi:nucleoside-diphosphate-sugar epimerase